MIRQWRILRAIESAADVTVKKLVDDLAVGERTIRRDLAALQEAGFPLYPQETDAGPYFWRLARPLGKLNDSAFTLAELCAFYANRKRLAAAGASPIDADLESAHDEGGAGPQPAHEEVPRRPRQGGGVQARTGAAAQGRQGAGRGGRDARARRRSSTGASRWTTTRSAAAG